VTNKVRISKQVSYANKRASTLVQQTLKQSKDKQNMAQAMKSEHPNTLNNDITQVISFHFFLETILFNKS